MGNNLRIEGKAGFGTKIFLNDIEIYGVRKYTLTHEAGEKPILLLEYPITKVEVDEEVENIASMESE